MRLYIFLQFVCFSLIAIICFQSLAAEDSCPSLISRIKNSQESDWEFHHGSTPSILIGSAALLTATEGARALHGSASFNQAFLVNSGIDLVMTFIGHQIAMIKLPDRLQKWLNYKTEFILRAGSNTIIDSIVMILAWKAAAMSKGVHIDAAEQMGAIAFCGLTYGCLQLWRNAGFKKMPKKLDLKYSEKLKAANSVFQVLANQSFQKAHEAKLDQDQHELLLLTFLENLVNTMPFESRINSESPLANYAKEIKTPKERKKFIRKLLTLYKKKIDEPTRDEIERVLYLGLPFTMEESINFHLIFAERQKKKDLLKLGSTVIDRTLGGVVAGGLIMRHMTQEVLKE